MNYTIVLRRGEEGYSVHCPELPGCWSQGETEEEALTGIRDAIREYLAAVEDISRAEVAGIDAAADDNQQAHQ